MVSRTAPAVTVNDLVKIYPRPGGGTLRALDRVSFEVADGEFFGFLGPNGAGKTTALEIIEGIRQPTSGEVRVLGVDPRKDLDLVKQMIGVQLQAASYFSLLTITEILELFGSFYPKRCPARQLLETVGLEDKGKAYVRHLSGGQQRRLSVAAAMVNDPEVIFLDEPTTGLDPQMRHSLWELLQRLNHDEGKTIVLTTHYMEEAELLADRVAIIDHGKIKAIGTPRNLIAPLDGVGHIEFAATAPVDVAELASLTGVSQVTSSGDGSLTAPSYRMAVTDPRSAVTSLFNWADGKKLDLRGLEVVPGTLEDVFLQLTGRELRE
ncbi:MAG: ATP-binding cassette domain-containing protein [Acidimicrobiia bacterium]|nr:ATP-binding cassette domain-containing protein [Acidimicrobiia bacterium]